MLDVTAKTPDGKEIFRESKIYMPVPCKMGVEIEMGRGPYEKGGLVRDTALPPLENVIERFDIFFPKKKGSQEFERQMIVDVKLWYHPFGRYDEDFSVLFRSFKKKILLPR